MKQIVDSFGDKEFNEDKDNEGMDELSEDKKQLDENECEINDNKSRHLSEVLNCLKRSDLKGLRRLATTGNGFITDRLRQQIWPKLSKVSVVETSPRPDADAIESHPFYTQVVLDVNRSLKRFPPSIAERDRISMQDSLIRLIMRVLIKNPDLHYFQGYHDICVTFLMILGEETAFYVVNQLSKTHFRVFMDKSMEKTVDLMDIIPIVIRRENKTLGEHFERAEVGTIFALSWVITWFSHVLPSYEDVSRLFDLFIVSNSLMPLYLTIALVLEKQNQILDIECEMPAIHQFLTRVPETESLPIESLIESALDLMVRYPPNDMIRAQELQKKYRLQTENRKKSLISKTFYNVFNTFFRLNVMSFTVLVVIAAAFYRFYWNV